MPNAGTLLGGEVQAQSMQPPSFIEKALRRLPSSLARDPKMKSDKDCGAIIDPIEQNNINKRRTTVFQKQTTDCQFSQQCSTVHLSKEVSCTKTLSTPSIVTTTTMQPLSDAPKGGIRHRDPV